MIDNTDFMESLSAEIKEYLSDQVHDLSKGQHEGYKDDLELVSRQRAIISRQLLSDLSESEIFLLRMYGTYGMTINFSVREHRKLLRDKSYAQIQSEINDFREKFNLKEIDPKKDFDLSMLESFKLEMTLSAPSYQGELSYHIRTGLDRLIDKKSSRFSKGDNYFYRISRAKKNSFGNEDTGFTQSKKSINPGDIITDDALWSSTVKSSIALLRYSYKGPATESRWPIEPNEEEILFMIKNNEFLKAIDISGYKFIKQFESQSAGEMLIKSSTKFRVVGIQKTERNLDRRIVILDPVNPAEITKDTVYKNAFNGEIMRRLWMKPALME